MVSDIPVDNEEHEDIPVDNKEHEAPIVTSGISKSAGTQSFTGAHRGMVCVRVHRSDCACVALYCVVLKKIS
jgi:hypothetical protein